MAGLGDEALASSPWIRWLWLSADTPATSSARATASRTRSPRSVWPASHVELIAVEAQHTSRERLLPDGLAVSTVSVADPGDLLSGLPTSAVSAMKIGRAHV